MPFNKKTKQKEIKGIKKKGVKKKKPRVFKSFRLSRLGCPDSGPAAFILPEESMGACRCLKLDLLTVAHRGQMKRIRSREDVLLLFLC